MRAIMYPKVMKYMEWWEESGGIYRDKISIPGGFDYSFVIFDANDMLLAMNRMVEDEKWKEFEECASDKFVAMLELPCLCHYHEEYIYWLFQPANFFRLLEEWLPEVNNE